MDLHTLSLNRSHMFTMQRHINHEAPLEACGILGGKNQVVEVVLPVKNAAESRVRFTMDPKAQLRAMEQLESEGLEILAIFHSHPKGPSVPSATDIKEAVYPVVNIIWSKAGRRWQARGFWIEAGQVTEVSLAVLDL
ncbi:MAG: M67 family metallopeptidase [Chloroflexi bacterium]|nr:M67 family metallopeptidase [Chloroflexota bacterium]